MFSGKIDRIKIDMDSLQVILEKNASFKLEESLSDNFVIPEDSVLVSTISVGLCSSDIPRCFDDGAYFYPIVIGHEFLVRIKEDPSGEYKQGERYAVFPLIPCKKCDSCKIKEYNKCSKYLYYGSRVDGGLQTELLIKKWNLVKVPDTVDNISGSLLEPVAVCVHTASKVKTEQKVLIYGGGFLSQILSQILEYKNCQITCIDRNMYKKDYFSNNIRFLHEPKIGIENCFDVVIECCGAKEVFKKCVDLVKPNGVIIQMANPSIESNIDYKTISSLMRKELQVIGTWNSQFRPDDPIKCDWFKSIDLIRKKIVNVKRLISHKENIRGAINLIEEVYRRRNGKSQLIEFNKGLISIEEVQ